MYIKETLHTEIKYRADVCVCGGGIGGIAVAMGDDVTSLDVAKLQEEIVRRGGKLHI